MSGVRDVPRDELDAALKVLVDEEHRVVVGG